MMYQMGWQKLLVNQVPRKGGGGGGGSSAPPPRDWYPEWNAVNTKATSAVKILEEVSLDTAIIASSADWQGKQAATDAKIDQGISLIDAALAENAKIPAEWFGRSNADRNAGIANLEKSRSNLLAYKGMRKPNEYERLASDINSLVLKLSAQNRYLSAPTQPMPADVIWPNGSWQYKLYTKGYNSTEVQWMEDYVARNELQSKYGYDQQLFLLQVEKSLDQEILNGSIPAKQQQEIITIEPWIKGLTGLPIPQPLDIPEPPAPAGYYPTGSVLGTGTYTGGAYPSYFDTVYAEDGGSYPNSSAVPKGLRYSKQPWEYRATGSAKPPVTQPIMMKIGLSYDAYLEREYGIRAGNVPPGIRMGSPEYAIWLRRQGRTRGFSRTTPVITQEQNPMVCVFPTAKSKTLRTDFFCGTGAMNPWDHQMLGKGYDMSTIQATRVAMRRTRIKPGTNMGSLANDMAGTIRQAVEHPPGGNMMLPGSAVDGATYTDGANYVGLGQSLGRLGGVLRKPPVQAVIRSKVLARRTCAMPRRGLVPSANAETFGDVGGGSNN